MSDAATTTHVPAVRFKGFEGDWEQRKLASVAEKVTRTDPNSNAPIMMITAQNGFINQSERYGFDNSGESLKKYTVLNKYDLAYNHGASKLRPYGSCFALTKHEAARVPFVYHCFSVGSNDPEFVSIELNSTKFEGQLRQIVSSGARMDGLLNISYDEYCSTMLFMPKVPEQQKVASYFQNIDTLIALQQQKYEKLQNVKKAMLAQMFPAPGATTPAVRFAGFTAPWQPRALGDMGTTFTGLAGKSKADFGHGNAEFITYMNVFANAVAVQNDMGRIEIDSSQNEVMEGDVLFTTSSETPDEVGMSSVWLADKANVYLNSFCFGWRPTEKFDPHYLAFMLRSDGVRKSFIFLAQGISRFNISKTKVMDIAVPVPEITEQRKIGEYFSNLDSLISLHQRKLEILQNVKKACLEGMFV